MSVASDLPKVAPLLISDGERSAEFKRRRVEFVFDKILPGAEAAYEAEGWTVDKALKRFIRIRRDKSLDQKFEDQVWRLFFKIGYDELNKGRKFQIRYKAADGTTRSKQIDIFAKDQETIVVGECKACEDFKGRSLSKDIAELIGLKKAIADSIRSHYGATFKPKILWFFFTHKVIWSDADRKKAASEQISIMTERELEYFEQLADHLGRATRYQFLAEYLGGQKVPHLKDLKVPAVKGKLGGQTFYSFVSTPDQLLKICFVNHRTLADPLAQPTYQRLVKKARLRAIGEFIKRGGYFPTNILINFEGKRQFDRKDKDPNSEVQFGDLHLPDKYKSAWIIDGQHRLYGFSIIDKKYSKQNITVLAFENLKREQEADLFVTINHEQKSVPQRLLDALDADLKWGSSKATDRLSSIAARIVQALNEEVGGAIFRRVIAEGLNSTEAACLTIPEIKGGILRAHLVGKLENKRKVIVDGPLCGTTDEDTVRRATKILNGYFGLFRDANVSLWTQGKAGFLCTNIAIRGMLLLLEYALSQIPVWVKGFSVRNANVDPLVQELKRVLKPLLDWVQSSSVEDLKKKLDVGYGSGAHPAYFLEIASIIHAKDPSFAPHGLAEFIRSKDTARAEKAEKIGKFIEQRITEILTGHFRALHGEKYWNYMGTPQMRVKAYQVQQEYPPEQQLPLEVYLFLIDKAKIIEKPENWSELKKFFDIPLPGKKGTQKNTEWIYRLNELRRIYAHPDARRDYKDGDFAFLEWLETEFKKKLLSVDVTAE
jgi:DNA sulfur modification protein DndB